MSFWKKKDNVIITTCVVAFFIGLTVWYGGAPFAPGCASAVGTSDIPFTNQSQEQLTLSKFKGKPLVVNFWATWCGVCLKKMGALNRFAEKFQAKGGHVLAISQDRDGLSKVQNYYTRNGYGNLTVYLEPSGQLASAFGVKGFPTAIFIDANGKEVGRLEGGFDWESKDINDLIKEYFGEQYGQ